MNRSVPTVPAPPLADINLYREGVRFIDLYLAALGRARVGDSATAYTHQGEADRALWMLGEYDRANDIRDFVAGVARALESAVASTAAGTGAVPEACERES